MAWGTTPIPKGLILAHTHTRQQLLLLLPAVSETKPLSSPSFLARKGGNPDRHKDTTSRNDFGRRAEPKAPGSPEVPLGMRSLRRPHTRTPIFFLLHYVGPEVQAGTKEVVEGGLGREGGGRAAGFVRN